MNLKKVKESPKGVNRLYRVLDSLLKKVNDELHHDVIHESETEAYADERAVNIEKYANNLNDLVEDGVTSSRDIIQTVDEILNSDERANLSKEIAAALDWPESLDDTIWDYVQHTKNSDEDLATVINVISGSSILTEEDKVILADEIVSSLEGV